MDQSRSDLLREQAKKQDRMLDLLQHCSKISNGLDKLAPNSGDRAIWELVQNAKDFSKECHICMKLTEDSFTFKHKGTPFNYGTLTSLIKQVSSAEKQFRDKNSDGQPPVGQYGTGFLTTHAFSRKIELKGSMEASLEGEDPCYVDLEDEEGKGFIIDREFKDIREFVDKMSDQIDAAHGLLDKTAYPEPKEWTELHYQLNESALKKASSALKQAKLLMPFVIAFNAKIKEVRIICDLGEASFDTTYRRGEDQRLDLVDFNVYQVRVDITGEDPRDIYRLCSADMTQQIVIPPTEFPAPDVTPSLFLYYPLLGTESFGTNFIFHSSDFTAKEERDGILLPSSNENAKEKFEKNTTVLNEMVDRLLDFLKKVEDRKFSLADNESLARVYFPCTGNAEKEQDEFFTSLKKRFVECMETLPLLNVDDEYASIQSGKVKVLHPSMYEGLKEESINTDLEVLKTYSSLAHTIPDKKLLEWSKIVAEWGTGKDEFFITYQDICDNIKDKRDKLKEFLQLMKESGQAALITTNKVVPNRKGVLCTGGSLQKAPNVTDQLYKISEPLLGAKADKLVDPLFSDFIDHDPYTRKNLREDMSTWLTDCKKESIDKGTVFSDDLLKSLYEFCSHYHSEGLNSFRNNVMPWIGKLYDFEYEERVLPSVEEKETDLYETPFGFLMECALLTISKKDRTWVEENGDLLYEIMSRYLAMTEERWTEKLKKYPLIPNQNHTLCLLEDLQKRESAIDEKLRQIYEDVFQQDPRDHWIDDRYAQFCTDQQSAKALAVEIQTELENRGYKDDVVLDIISLLEEGHWGHALFGGIDSQKEKLRYNFTTPAQRVHINKLIKAKNDKLLEKMAQITECNDPGLVIRIAEKAIADAKEQEYIKMLGEYVERHLLAFLRNRLKDDGIEIIDQQGGQDYIVSKPGFSDYRIEVKSRWSVDKSVEMSKLQFETAVGHPDRFSLIMANMEDFPRERVVQNDPLTDDELIERIKVLDDVGNNSNLLNRIKDAFRGGEDDIRADGSYTIRVPQASFVNRKLGLLEFEELLKGKFCND